MTDLPKCVLCKSETMFDNDGVWCADEHSATLSRCPQSVGYYTTDQWRLLNDPGPQLSERTREREGLARELFLTVVFGDAKHSFDVADQWLDERDKWRAKDGVE